ncbi:hypothetical protein L1887_55215 [Cichorium endivia]|nr:hypothetical protein L1887_55215 [Cichorium endivia]
MIPPSLSVTACSTSYARFGHASQPPIRYGRSLPDYANPRAKHRPRGSSRRTLLLAYVAKLGLSNRIGSSVPDETASYRRRSVDGDCDRSCLGDSDCYSGSWHRPRLSIVTPPGAIGGRVAIGTRSMLEPVPSVPWSSRKGGRTNGGGVTSAPEPNPGVPVPAFGPRITRAWSGSARSVRGRRGIARARSRGSRIRRCGRSRGVRVRARSTVARGITISAGERWCCSIQMWCPVWS